MSMPKSFFLIQGVHPFWNYIFFGGQPRLISNAGLTNPDLTLFANLDVVRDLVLQGAGACHCRSNTKPFPSLLPSWERHRSRSAWSGTPPLCSGSRSTWSAFGWLRPRQKMTATPCPSSPKISRWRKLGRAASGRAPSEPYAKDCWVMVL